MFKDLKKQHMCLKSFGIKNPPIGQCILSIGPEKLSYFLQNTFSPAEEVLCKK